MNDGGTIAGRGSTGVTPAWLGINGRGAGGVKSNSLATSGAMPVRPGAEGRAVPKSMSIGAGRGEGGVWS
ncbi:hypothetical protein, partial [Bradyrhizobium sp. NBAIM08]|uniref:hypothetical protein n=1 Tax=Bradyrhizobium sp. NBAIM08 TaxID=2793815 RepID=UPI001CD4DCAB